MRRIPLLIALVFLAGMGLALAALPGGGGASGPEGFVLLSAGRDGVVGTADDLYVTGRGEVTKGGLNLASLGLGAGDLVPSSRPVDEGVPAAIVLTADRTSVPADGTTAITVTAEVLDRYGNPVPDGTEVAFSTTLGALSPSACATEGGVARTALVSSVAGTATVTAVCGTAQGSLTVEFVFAFRYLIVEVFDHHGSNAAAINEVEVYNRVGSRLSYTTPNAYDSATGSYPAYWFNSPISGAVLWDHTNLNDGNTGYGEYSSTLFVVFTNPNTGHWSRFVVDLGSVKEIAYVRVAVGSSIDRNPKQIKVYGCNSYSYDVNLRQRRDDNLTFIGSKSIAREWLPTVWVVFP